MGKVKYFKSLPDQLYIYKRFDSVGKMERWKVASATNVVLGYRTS